ncbi:MAG TPA: CHAT domain-containing protein, partial [Blastocatellia bacterium]|nr:CHAT domain-containing protein [Blastocatellia bacterium]
MNRLLYLDFELKIERDADAYIARVLHSPAGEAANSFVLPFSEDRLENLVLKIGRLRSTTRAVHTPEMEAARELGGQLFEAVFGNELRACLRSSLDLASRQEETGLRLKLRLQEVPELADPPWEFLLDPSRDRFLAQSNQTPIVRYLELPERIKPLALDLPLNVLVMMSSPSDQVRLDVEREKSHLQDALRSLSEQGRVNVTWLENATLTALQRCLRGGTYHVFHFIGHGGFHATTQEGVLVLEDAQGRGWQAGAHRIGTHLHDHRSLRLAVLNSCEGARNSRTDPFAGVAGTLIRQGVPAVVAMQFEITDEAAITFASEFYSSLAEGIPVDAAVAEARKAIYALPNDVEWATPVLYMRSPDGVLFNPSQTLRVEKPRAAPVESAARPSKQKSASKAERTTPAASKKAIADSKRAAAPAAKARSEPSIRLRTVRPLLGHTKTVHSVAFSPDGLTVASCAATGLIFGDNTVRVWRVTDGKLLRTFTGHGHTVFSVAFSPDGQLLASGSADKTVRVWRLGKGKRSFELSHFEMAAVKSVAFSPDGSR